MAVRNLTVGDVFSDPHADEFLDFCRYLHFEITNGNKSQNIIFWETLAPNLHEILIAINNNGNVTDTREALHRALRRAPLFDDLLKTRLRRVREFTSSGQALETTGFAEWFNKGLRFHSFWREFFMSFKEGRDMLEKLDAINRQPVWTPDQIKRAFEIMKDMPALNNDGSEPGEYFLNDFPASPRHHLNEMSFTANTGIHNDGTKSVFY